MVSSMGPPHGALQRPAADLVQETQTLTQPHGAGTQTSTQEPHWSYHSANPPHPLYKAGAIISAQPQKGLRLLWGRGKDSAGC